MCYKVLIGVARQRIFSECSLLDCKTKPFSTVYNILHQIYTDVILRLDHLQYICQMYHIRKLEDISPINTPLSHARRYYFLLATLRAAQHGPLHFRFASYAYGIRCIDVY